MRDRDVPTPSTWQVPIPREGEPRDAFFERLRPALMRIAQDLMDRELQAKIGTSDLVQETMLEVVRDIDQVRDKNPKNMERWYREVLINNIRDLKRFFRGSRKRTVDVELPLLKDLADPRSGRLPEVPLLREEQMNHMQEAISRLPSPHQQMLKWRYMDRFSYRKIATLVSRKEDAVRMMVNRSLDRLKREMSRLNDSTVQ